MTVNRCCAAVEVTRSGRQARKRAHFGGSFAAVRELASQWSQDPPSADEEEEEESDSDSDSGEE